MATEAIEHPATDMEQLERLDQFLAETREERRQEKAQRSVSLAAILGEYEPLAGHARFWARAPKLRQQIEIARISEEQAATESDVANIEGAAKMARLAIFREQGGEVRQATLDEVLDEFTVAEVADVLKKYLGMSPVEGGDPNA